MKPDYLKIQEAILLEIKDKSEEKLVDALVSALNISIDAAYRRIRLEKVFTLDELIILNKVYGVSLDQHLTNGSADSVLFTFPFKNSQFDLIAYFSKILEHLTKIKKSNGTLYYSAKDIPIFHFFQNKKLLAFKLHYWLTTMNSNAEFINKDFSYDIVPAKLSELTKNIYNVYASINTHEIWNYETLTRNSNQISYYYEMGIISEETAIDLQNQLIELVNHLEEECKIGQKFFMGSGNHSTEENYHFYYNEILAADNSIYAEYNGIQESFLPHIVLNYMITSNEQYSAFNKSVFDNVINKSTLITKVNERDRRKFFNYNRKFILNQLKRIEIL